VNDAFLVDVLDGLANGDEEFEALTDGEAMIVAVARDGDAFDQLHHEVGAAGDGGAGVKDASDVGMVHQGEGLALGGKAGDDRFRVHALLYDF
jgi:hypothetical protein